MTEYEANEYDIPCGYAPCGYAPCGANCYLCEMADFNYFKGSEDDNNS